MAMSEIVARVLERQRHLLERNRLRLDLKLKPIKIERISLERKTSFYLARVSYHSNPLAR